MPPPTITVKTGVLNSDTLDISEIVVPGELGVLAAQKNSGTTTEAPGTPANWQTVEQRGTMSGATPTGTFGIQAARVLDGTETSVVVPGQTAGSRQIRYIQLAPPVDIAGQWAWLSSGNATDRSTLVTTIKAVAPVVPPEDAYSLVTTNWHASFTTSQFPNHPSWIEDFYNRFSGLLSDRFLTAEGSYDPEYTAPAGKYVSLTHGVYFWLPEEDPTGPWYPWIGTPPRFIWIGIEIPPWIGEVPFELSDFTWHGYGDSWMAGDYFGQPSSARWPNLITAEDDKALSFVNTAVGGDGMQEVVGDFIGTTNPWTLQPTNPEQHRIIVHALLNDVRKRPNDAKSLDGFEEAFRALCVKGGAEAWYPDTDAMFAKGGSWSSAGHFKAWGGSTSYSDANGATITYTIDRDHHIQTWGFDDAEGTVGATFDITVDGQPFLSGTTHNIGKDVNGLSGTSVANMVIPITGLSPGSHTIVVTKTDTGRLIFNGVSVPMPNPPTILVNKGAELDWSMPGVMDPYGSNQSLADFNARVDVVAAEFDNVYVVDFQSGWDFSTMIGSDELHPTISGNRHIADAVLAQDPRV